jgi:vacuolar-type H+-ATPase subunit H
MAVLELSPIVAIRQKELELADRISEAKREAEQSVAAAHQRASDQLVLAEHEAQEEAASLRRSWLLDADSECRQLRACSDRKVAQITEQGAIALDRAVQAILEIVLPRAGD